MPNHWKVFYRATLMCVAWLIAVPVHAELDEGDDRKRERQVQSVQDDSPSSEDLVALEHRTSGLVRGFRRDVDTANFEEDLTWQTHGSGESSGVQSTPALGNSGFLAERASRATHVSGEMVEIPGGFWRVSRHQNPRGHFSLLRSTGKDSPPLRVTIGDGAPTVLSARETLTWPCTQGESAKTLSVKSDSGKAIHLGELACGDGVSFSHGQSQ